ncbi:MAG: DegT/DnrJ/EryC1/StrS family aminotransferase [Lentisphaerae bacterium]|nr:DegT/DnrJ/EryC1/StrS family aminotransferase [Lentisphaerota bacterium]
MYEMGKAEIDAVVKVIKSKQFMRYRGGEGGYTENFERDLCAKFDIAHALTVNSGTSALICALAAMGVGPGDEVIVPAYTWVASALAPLAIGAVPVMADIDETLTISPEDIERRITKFTKAIIPVHMSNLACDMDAIMKIAKKHNLLVCEDACQAIGASYKGKRLGTIGHTGAYSFNQFKNITCGEGGAVVTNNERYYERALMYHDAGCFTRAHASNIKEPFFPGVNYRVSEIQGAIMGEQLKRLDKIIGKLQEGRKIITDVFAGKNKFKVVAHNDESNAVGVAIIFDTLEEALAFKEKNGMGLLIESGRHVYTNWEPLLEQRSFHPKMNPFNWAQRKIEYTKDMCGKTLEILSRSAGIAIPYEMTKKEIRDYAKKIIS